MKAINLRVEYLKTPVGIDITNPRFYWNCDSGIRQTAYEIVCKSENREIWNSGKVSSSAMSHIVYKGEALKSRQSVTWFVRLWDENDVVGEAASDSFEMGLLSDHDWSAKWISGDYKPKKNKRYPADCFRKKIRLQDKVKTARLYISACGLYEANINGRKVGDFMLAPGCTDYRKRLQYQTYDITDMLNGKNADITLEIILGDGWYRGSVGCFGATNVFGRSTSFICQMEICYENGSKETIISDDTFEWSADGAICFNDLKDGEVYDAGRVPSYGGKARLTNETQKLTASNNVFPVEKEHFKAKLIKSPSGKQILDFGQNIAGIIAFKVKGKKGQKIRLLMGEILDENGEFTQKNIQSYKPKKEIGKVTELKLVLGQDRKMNEKNPDKMQPTPKQEIVFTCSGGQDFYKTKFAVFGFRYALIESETAFNAADFEAVAVYSDLEQTSSFHCSNEKVNKFYENTVWSMKGNFLDIPTDCPTRERLGWTGDAQVFFETGAYLMNIAPFFRKWLLDCEDGIMQNGVIPAVIPYASFELLYNNTAESVGWGDAAVLLPYRYWKRYGDTRVLEHFYDTLAKPYAEFMLKNTGHIDKKEAAANPYNKYVYEKGRHLGEWLEPQEFQDKVSANSQIKQIEVSAAYFHYSTKAMAEMAHALGRKSDEERYKEYADGSRKAYQYLFLKDGAPDTDRQAKLVRPLALGLADDSGALRRALEERLAKAVENRKYCIGTGFLSTPFVLQVLTNAGESGLAYKMLENEKAPGWLNEVNMGATTVWEDWEGTVSHNHYSPGAVCKWMIETVCGINADGENHFRIVPIPGGSLNCASASYKSLYGEVKASWKKENGRIVYNVEIPPNCTAEIVLQGENVRNVGAGKYEYETSV